MHLADFHAVFTGDVAISIMLHKYVFWMHLAECHVVFAGDVTVIIQLFGHVPKMHFTDIRRAKCYDVRRFVEHGEYV